MKKVNKHHNDKQLEAAMWRVLAGTGIHTTNRKPTILNWALEADVTRQTIYRSPLLDTWRREVERLKQEGGLYEDRQRKQKTDRIKYLEKRNALLLSKLYYERGQKKRYRKEREYFRKLAGERLRAPNGQRRDKRKLEKYGLIPDPE